LIVTTGPYVNDITSKLGFEIDLDLWEMGRSYYNIDPKVSFPSMWFQFREPKDDADENLSNLFFGFPAGQILFVTSIDDQSNGLMVVKRSACRWIGPSIALDILRNAISRRRHMTCP
jgi:hypothetical protein